jgi:hypothetical protein
MTAALPSRRAAVGMTARAAPLAPISTKPAVQPRLFTGPRDVTTLLSINAIVAHLSSYTTFMYTINSFFRGTKATKM